MDAQELEQHLDEVRRKRGYLLPHHGLMATALPGMLEDYDRLYSSLALTPRHLSRRDHEVVWLVVLIAVNEALGTHHLARYREAGGEAGALDSIISLAGFCRGASVWCFVADSWAAHLPDLAARDGYEAALLAAAGDLPPRLAYLGSLAAHACASEWRLFDWALEAAYGAGVDERDMAEALSLVAFPGSVPNFARACGAWQAAILAGRVQASEPFRVWAELSGQGGYDEASGVGGSHRP
jgi:alkylhydroperoxidase/carboxymuconolactone decarboxylase family protein YurZ